MPQYTDVDMALNPDRNGRQIATDDSGNAYVLDTSGGAVVLSGSIANNVPPIVGQVAAPGLFWIEGI